MSTLDYSSLNPGWFRSSGRSGLKLPAVSLGCWQNFGEAGSASHGLTDEGEFHDHARLLLWTAFEHGITHFDFANNYGPPPGAAEERCGRILKELPREELIISSKAGYDMWNGPYGDGGSRKYLVTSCDQSLRRLGGEYLDIFYHHRPDPTTPLEETLGALDFIVRSGRALYVGLSNYPAERTREAMALCDALGLVKPIIHQPRYSMLDRHIEPDLFEAAEECGMGVICFSPLAQGQLSGKYLAGIPGDSRASNEQGALSVAQVEGVGFDVREALNAVAQERGESLAQLAIRWVLRWPQVTSALIGASRPEQIVELTSVVDGPPLEASTCSRIDAILSAP